MPESRRIEGEWDEIAHRFWVQLGRPAPPVDSYRLCAELGLRVLVGETDGRTSYIDFATRTVHISRTRSERQRYFAAAHEAVHWLLPNETRERAINYIAAAILLPREHVEPWLANTWDLAEFADSFGPHLSFEVLGRRLLSLRPDAAISVWLEGELLCALRWPGRRYPHAAPLERILAERLFVDRSAERFDIEDRLFAVADDTTDGRWVVTVAEAARLRVDNGPDAPGP